MASTRCLLFKRVRSTYSPKFISLHLDIVNTEVYFERSQHSALNQKWPFDADDRACRQQLYISVSDRNEADIIIEVMLHRRLPQLAASFCSFISEDRDNDQYIHG